VIQALRILMLSFWTW